MILSWKTTQINLSKGVLALSSYDAFTAGVEPGGLRTQNDIKILICYLLDSIDSALSIDDLTKILQEKSLANYFEIIEAVNSLIEKNCITVEDDGFCSICEKGRKIAETLDTTLPLSVRDKALSAAVATLSYARNERENRVDIIPWTKGFQVICHVSGGDLDLMQISLYVPDEKQAKMVKENFHNNPAKIYETLLKSLTSDE